MRDVIPVEKLPPKLESWLRKPDEPDRVYTKNKKIEVVFLVEAVNAILPRTEGPDDITLLKIPGTDVEVPTILPEKLQAVTRRRMVGHLARFKEARPDRIKKYLTTLSDITVVLKSQKNNKKGKKEKNKEEPKQPKEHHIGFTKAKEMVNNPLNWNCQIQSPGGDSSNNTDEGVDGFCPACALFGTIIGKSQLNIYNRDKSESVGLKSRVEFDPAFTFLDSEIVVADYTHNKVTDGVSWTGKSLFEERHVVPGTVFVGKVTLEDVTETELLSFLATLSTVTRLGGRERIFGGVRIHIVGVRGGSYETVSALELAKYLTEVYKEVTTLPTVGDVMDKVADYISTRGFILVDPNSPKVLVDDMGLWDKLWSDTVHYDIQVIRKIMEIVYGRDRIIDFKYKKWEGV